MASAKGIRAGAAYVELYAEDSRLARGLHLAQRRLKAFSASIRQLGAGLLKIGAAVAAPVVAGTKVYADFEQQMANVATMLDDPGQYMDEFRRGIRRMAMEFGESTKTLAGGLYDILSASVPAEHALDVLAVSARAARAGLTDTAIAADAITTMLNAYGLSADKATNISDLLFTVVRRGKTTFAELAPGIGNVANIASTAGLSLEEMGATIALLTRNGIKTEEAITALRAVLTAFLKPSAEGADLARELGFEMNVATLKAEGLAGVFARIGKLPPEAIATLFPNVRALKGVLPALQSLKGFGEDIEAMRKRAGSTETAYAKMTGTLAHSFAQVKQSAVAVLAVIGEALSKPMERAAGVLKRYLGLLTDWLAKNKELVVTAVKIGAVVGLIGAALVTLGTAGLTLSFVFGGIASIVSLVGTLFAGLGAVLGTLLSPIGLIVAGMGLLSVAFLKASGLGAKAVAWLGEQFAVLEADVREAWKGIGDALAAGDLGLAARILWLTLKMEWERGIHELHRAWIGFKEAFQSVITGAFYGVQVYLVDAWAGLRAGWVDTVSFLGQVWAGFIAGLQRGWNTAGGFIQKRFLEIMGLFDSELDVGLAKRITDEKIADLDRTLVAGLAGVLQESDAEREAKKVAIRRDRDRAVTEIAAEADTEDQARRRAYEEDLKGSEAALARARQEWREAIAAAGQKRPATEGGEEAPAISTDIDATTAKGVHRSFEALQDQLGRVSGAIDDTLARTTRIDTVGTFNAAAAAGLGSSNAADRTAKATEETARNTKRLVTEFSGDGEMEFA